MKDEEVLGMIVVMIDGVLFRLGVKDIGSL